MLKEYKTVSEISGPLMMVEGVENAKFGHMVDIELTDGTMRHGQILQVQGDKVMVQVFEGTSGIDVSGTTVRFLGKPMELGVSPDILGRVFSGTGVPIDNGPAIISQRVYPDGDQYHRWAQPAGAWAKASDFFRLGFAA
jgi:V/A-type H+-transporting ATPase subunit B